MKSTMKTCCVALIAIFGMGAELDAEPAKEPLVQVIKKLNTEKAVWADATRKKPIVLKSADAAVKYFGKEGVAKIEKSIDFKKQMVLVFAWRGSGQDRMEYEVLESSPKKVLFSYRPGLTRDLRPHIKISLCSRMRNGK